MEFTQWLAEWLSRHPLKSRPPADHDRFTADVMARVRSEAAQPSPGWAARFAQEWPRLALPLAAAAAVLIAVNAQRSTETRVAAELTRHAELLAELGDPLEDVLPAGAVELAEDLRHEDLIVLAEAPPESNDAAWINESMQILEDIDEALPDAASGDEGNSEEWLQELEMLDQSELAAQS
jgi:hypothetical protein